MIRFIGAAVVSACAAGLVVASSHSAQAGCHLIDCVEPVIVKKSEIKSMSCDQLWLLRNSIYDEAGYCFKTARGKKAFVNEGCTYSDVNDVPLSNVQRKNVKTFKTMESAKGC